ncbi:MAG: hypothetical protein CMG61_02800 [Candidatus Marinimicrobia bacterium]|nr:hypothetical protein [Candidatus Neomarinimicrobiota bacterium]|tara:strand:+ start:28922 stop:29551 length:630 start_codon:yes stop_codon:yes gene_type:complete
MSNQIKNILKKINLENFDFQSLLNRNVILVIVTLVFISLNYILVSYFFKSKIDLIEELEEEQKIVNEKFITAQILSEELDNVYSVFEQNLASNKNDPKNKESNMLFLKDLTDILEKLEIKLIQIEPGGKKRKGLLTLIPYTMELKCNYEEIGKLVTELEASNRLITVDEIIIKNGIEKIKKNNNNQDAINDVKTILSINTVTLNKPKQK